MRSSSVLLSLAALSFAVAGCQNQNQGDMHHDHAMGGGDMHHEGDMRHAADMRHEGDMHMQAVNNAIAVIYPTKGSSVSGTINFDKTAGGVHIHGAITGLEPNSTHACHIHEFGDQSSADGSSAGSHYDPEGTHHHGGPTTKEPHHPGDLGNITADASGKATIDLTIPNFTIAGMKDPVIGRAVVIHAKADDFTDPVGNAGGRIGVGIIGVAKSQS